MPHKPCLEAGCPNPSIYRGRCSLHAKQRERSIDRQGKPLYNTKRWKMLRRHKLNLNPLCEWDGCNAIAQDVHHKHGVEVDPWSVDGLESLCHAHHSRLTRMGQVA